MDDNFADDFMGHHHHGAGGRDQQQQRGHMYRGGGAPSRIDEAVGYNRNPDCSDERAEMSHQGYANPDTDIRGEVGGGRVEEPNEDDFSTDELKSLVANFSRLSQQEQDDLVQYMKRLETRDPNKLKQVLPLMKGPLRKTFGVPAEEVVLSSDSEHEDPSNF